MKILETSLKSSKLSLKLQANFLKVINKIIFCIFILSIAHIKIILNTSNANFNVVSRFEFKYNEKV